MYGVPKSFDPSAFLCRTVENVCFYAYSVFIDFDGSYSITIDGRFEHQVSPDETPSYCDCEIPLDESKLMRLIGRAVVAADVEEGRNFVLSADLRGLEGAQGGARRAS